MKTIVFVLIFSSGWSPAKAAMGAYSGDKYNNGFPEEKYHLILDQVEKHFAKIVAEKGGELIIWRDWTDGAVNMWAEKWGDQYILEIPGGMSRYHLIIEEAFVTSICHELGHLLGGVPMHGEISFEGQSDYFAGKDCVVPLLRLIQPLSSLQPDVDVIQVCQKQTFLEDDICWRALQGAKSLTSYYAEILNVEFPQLNKKSTKKVTQTLADHPEPQCRLDTLKAGLLRDQRPNCWFVP